MNPDEIARAVHSMNGLLERLFDQPRRNLEPELDDLIAHRSKLDFLITAIANHHWQDEYA